MLLSRRVSVLASCFNDMLRPVENISFLWPVYKSPPPLLFDQDLVVNVATYTRVYMVVDQLSVKWYVVAVGSAVAYGRLFCRLCLGLELLGVVTSSLSVCMHTDALYISIVWSRRIAILDVILVLTLIVLRLRLSFLSIFSYLIVQ